MELYDNKKFNYFSNCRYDLIKHIKIKQNQAILEIGAGNGATLSKIKEMGLAEKVVGVDLVDKISGTQGKSLIDEFHIINIESVQTIFKEGSFDTILCGDVLEHLVDPWSTLKYLNSLIKNEGQIIATLPNIQKLEILFSIFLGDFKYTDDGILDKTHLRFFCKKNLYSLFSDAGFSNIKIYPNYFFETKSKKRLLNKLTFNILMPYITRQYLIIASK